MEEISRIQILFFLLASVLVLSTTTPIVSADNSATLNQHAQKIIRLGGNGTPGSGMPFEVTDSESGDYTQDPRSLNLGPIRQIPARGSSDPDVMDRRILPQRLSFRKNQWRREQNEPQQQIYEPAQEQIFYDSYTSPMPKQTSIKKVNYNKRAFSGCDDPSCHWRTPHWGKRV
ncbi:uncharacterized protein LOC134853114 [Symsagittifera roscoffensis]|uniref:uncharacterized protein LOC134853114 n=1 Tax=Symsagittifera roscoffensis TaxID=84072 RepID=UPI00307B8248